MDIDLSGRVALVTGASRGIGRAVALAYAKAGAHVVITGRSEGGLTETDDLIRGATGHEATIIVADLARLEKVGRMGAALYQRFGKLDIVVGNAATLGTLGPVAASKPRMFENTLKLNVTAQHRLIQSMDPLLRQSDAGRAIFVTSGVARAPKAYWGAYAASKAALEALVRIYAEESAGSSVRANLVDPGVVATEMRAAAFPGEDASQLPQPDSVIEPFLKLADPAFTGNGELHFAQAG
ncbi:MAG: SDR family NAD(P)-dependent oxidoreductase [Alphaproteobacteria bacterium]